MLRKELPEFYAYAKDCGLLTTLNTNGWLVKDRIGELAPFVDMAQISIDSPVPQENDHIRGIRGAYARAVEALKLFKEYSVPVNGVCTLTNQTLGRLKGLSELAQNLGIDMNVNIVFPAPLEHDHDETDVAEMTVDYQECANRLEAARKFPNLIISRNMIELLRKGGNRIEKPICRAASVMATVTANGQMLLPCLYYPEAHFDLSREYLHVRDAWDSGLAWKVRAGCGRYPFCDGCIIRCYLETSELAMPRDWRSFSLLLRDDIGYFREKVWR